MKCVEHQMNARKIYPVPQSITLKNKLLLVFVLAQRSAMRKMELKKQLIKKFGLRQENV